MLMIGSATCTVVNGQRAYFSISSYYIVLPFATSSDGTEYRIATSAPYMVNTQSAGCIFVVHHVANQCACFLFFFLFFFWPIAVLGAVVLDTSAGDP